MQTSDLFEKEQKIYEAAVKRLSEIQHGSVFELEEYEKIVGEYGKLLKQIRNAVRLADRMNGELNKSKLDLLGQIQYDELTGVYSRRFMKENLKRLIRTVASSNDVISVFMVDIDFFKKYNDTYGHCEGDRCLKWIAQALEESINPKNDFVARYGGEEFAIILPYTAEEDARITADKILENIKKCNIPHEKNIGVSWVTVSIGVTTVHAKCTHKYSDYLEQADKALYLSKQNGRNQYTFLSFEGV